MSRLDRRGFLRSLAAASAALALPSILWPQDADQAKKPNILFIFSDDHAPHAISAYGSKINTTPNIDRIASEGAILKRNTCCNSICGPSRAAILTGKHSHANGFRTHADTFDGSQQTFPKLLQAGGYQTALIGKWHLTSDPTGFDHWDILPGQGAYYNPVFITAEGRRKVFGYNTDIVTDLSIEWMQETRDKSKPFMLMCQFKAPHRTWMPGPDHLNMYDDVDIPEPDTLFDDYKGKTTPITQNEMSIARHLEDAYDLKLDKPGSERDARISQWTSYYDMSPDQKREWDAAFDDENAAFRAANLQGDDLVRWKYQRYIKNYLRCIASVDDNIGRILDYLAWSGLAENTLVIYSSDQGFYLGDHGMYDKRWMYEESLGMPFVARMPGVISPGTVVEDLTQNIDFGPTFLDVAGVPVPGDMQGRSLMPLLRGEDPPDWRKSLYYHYYEKGEHNVARHEGVTTGRYKLIHFYDTDEWEFFDLQEDPDELQSQYANPEYASRVAEMKAELERLKALYKVPADNA